MPIRVEIVSQDRPVFEGDVDIVVAPGEDGEMGILPHHAPLLTTLKPGVLRVRTAGREEAFAISGGLAAFGGVLLAGYASKAAQSMGDAYLLPSIAAVVLGGTSILGGRGSYLGTIAGVILITLLQSILSVMQMPEFGRQIIYGVVIIVMLLLYGRERLVR